MTGSPRDICWAAGGSSARAATCRCARVVEGLATDHLAVADERDQQLAVVAVVRRRGGRCRSPRPRPRPSSSVGAGRTCGRRWRSCRRSSWPPTRARPSPFSRDDELVDEAGRRVAAAGDELGADAVAVDRRRGQRGDRELVEVAGHHDPGAGRAEGVELGAHLLGEHAEVAGVDADGAQLGAGHLDAEPDRLGDVVGVDQQRGAGAQRGDLGAERVRLAVVQERERVRAGARRSGCRSERGRRGWRWSRTRRRTPPARPPPPPPRGCAASPSRCRAGRRPPSVIREAAEAIAESWL